MKSLAAVAAVPVAGAVLAGSAGASTFDIVMWFQYSAINHEYNGRVEPLWGNVRQVFDNKLTDVPLTWGQSCDYQGRVLYVQPANNNVGDYYTPVHWGCTNVWPSYFNVDADNLTFWVVGTTHSGWWSDTETNGFKKINNQYITFS